MSKALNQWLSSTYGIGEEKTASAQTDGDLWELFKQAAAEDGIDADALSEEQVNQLSALYTQQGAGGEQPAAQPGADNELPPNWTDDDVNTYNSLPSDGEKQAFVQIKECELLGDVIGQRHLGVLKEAGVLQAAKNWGQLGAYGASRANARAGATAREVGKSIGGLASFKGMRERANVAGSLKSEIGGLKGVKGDAEKAKRLGGHLREARKGMAIEGGKSLGAYGAAAGAAGGAVALAKRNREKQAQAIEALAIGKARDFLKEAGVDPDTGIVDPNPTTEPANEIDPVDARAVELLQENGYGDLLEAASAQE